MFNCLVLNYCHAAPLPIHSPLLSEKSLWSGGHVSCDVLDPSTVELLALYHKPVSEFADFLFQSWVRKHTHGWCSIFWCGLFSEADYPWTGRGHLKSDFWAHFIFFIVDYCVPNKCLINWTGQCSIFRCLLKEFRIIFKTDKMLIYGAKISRYF